MSIRPTTMSCLVLSTMLCSVSIAATYHVDGDSKAASDDNAGTSKAPWKTISRATTGNDSDYNIFARTSPTPTMRHSWNPDNTLDQWRDRFGEDSHSRLLPVQFDAMGTAFRLRTDKDLDAAGPLPESLPWRPANPKRIGCKRTHWP